MSRPTIPWEERGLQGLLTDNIPLEEIYKELTKELDIIGQHQEKALTLANSLCGSCPSASMQPSPPTVVGRTTASKSNRPSNIKTTTSRNIAQLLLSNSNSTFLWSDLVNARLMVDTLFVDHLHYSKSTGFVRIAQQTHHQDPLSSPHQATKSRQDLKTFLCNMALSTSKAVKGANICAIEKISARSLNQLFGLNPTLSSVDKARQHLQNLGYKTRRDIICSLVGILQANHGTPRRRRGLDPSAFEHAYNSTVVNAKTEHSSNMNQRIEHHGDPFQSNHSEPSPTGGKRRKIGNWCPPIDLSTQKTDRLLLDIPYCLHSHDHLQQSNAIFFDQLQSSMSMNNHTSFDKFLQSQQLVNQLTAARPTPAIPNTCTTDDDEDHANHLPGSFPQAGCKIQIQKLKSLNPSKPRPYIFSASPFLSSELKELTLRTLDSSLFLKGRQGRNFSFVRCASTSHVADGQFFQIGRTFYPTCPATEPEEAILELFNSFARSQCATLRSLHPNNEPQFTTAFNTLQIVVSCINSRSGYKEHDDFGQLVGCSNHQQPLPHEIISQSPVFLRLPNKYEFQTPTLVLTNHVDQTKSTHNVSWTYDGQHAGQISTNGNLFHFQAHGCQDGYLHSVTPIPGSLSGRTVRIVISGRYLVPLSQEIIEKDLIPATSNTRYLNQRDYKFTKVLTNLSRGRRPMIAADHQAVEACATSFAGRKSRTEEVTTCFDDDDDELSSVASIDYKDSPSPDESDQEYVDEKDESTPYKAPADNRKQQSKQILGSINDALPSIRYDAFKLYRIHRNDELIIERSEDIRHYMLSASVVKHLVLKFGIIPVVTLENETNNKPNTVVPSLFGFCPGQPAEGGILLEPFACLNSEFVTAEGGISHNTRAHPPTCGDETKCNLIVVSKPYKNDVDSFVGYVKKLATALLTASISPPSSDSDKMPQTEDASQQPYVDLDFPVTIYGSGGNAMMSDQFGCDLSKVNKEDAIARMASSQSIDACQTYVLTKLSERDGVVALFIALDEFYDYFDEETLSNLRLVNKGFSEDEANRTSQSMFLGYFYLDFCQLMKPLNNKKLEAIVDKLNTGVSRRRQQENEKNVCFMKEKHWKFCLRPLLKSWDDIKAFRSWNNGVQRWRPLSVLVNENDIVRPRIVLPISQPLTSVVRASRTMFDLEQFIECFVEQTILPMLAECNKGGGNKDDGVPELVLRTVVPSGTKVKCLNHAITICCYVSVACCMRYLRASVTSDGKNACPLSDQRLPIVNRAHSTAMAARCLDVVALTIRASAVLLGILRRGIGGVRSTEEISNELFFQAIFNRFTGRPKIFSEYRRAKNGVTSSFIPTRNEMEDFLLHVAGTERAYQMLINSQHDECIPQRLRKNWACFTVFVRYLIQLSDKILQSVQSTKSRESAVHTLTNWLRHIYSQIGIRDRIGINERSRTRFLAGQIIADLEEIYSDPFGVITIESVPVGYGGTIGLSTLTGGTQKNNASKLLQLLTALKKSARENPAIRDMLTLSLCAEDALVFKLNGRPLSIVDVEHMCCKLYIALSKTVSTRARSKHPQSSKGGHHPIDFNGEVPWEDTLVKSICAEAVTSYQRAWDAGEIDKAPTICRIPGESDRTETGILIFDDATIEDASNY